MFCYSLLLVAMVNSIQDQKGGPTPAELTMLKAIRNEYEANRAALAPADITFHLDAGNANSIKDGLDGKWTSRWRAEGRYSFDEKKTRYECVYSAKDIAANLRKTGQNELSNGLPSYRFMSDGDSTLVDIVTVGQDGMHEHQSQIIKGTADMYVHVVCAYDLNTPPQNQYQLGEDIDALLAGKPDWKLIRIEQRVQFEGVEVVLVAFGRPGSSVTYWVDLQRGSCPIQIRETNADESIIRQFNYSDFLHHDNHGWFPHRMTILNQTGKNGGFAREFVVNKAAFGKVPGDTFELTYPKPINILNVPKSLIYENVNKLKVDEFNNSRSIKSRPVTVSANAPVAPVATSTDRDDLSLAARRLQGVIEIGHGILLGRSADQAPPNRPCIHARPLPVVGIR